MTVDVTLDLFVEIQFSWTGRFPSALIDEIARRKNEIYQQLKPDPQRPDMLVGSAMMIAEGRRFDVLFAADLAQTDPASDVKPMRVINIDELK